MIPGTKEWTTSCEWRLDGFEPIVARRMVENILSLWGVHAETIDDAKLITSEVATNAAEHVRRELRKAGVIHFRIDLSGDTLRFEISDPDPRPPLLIRAAHDDEQYRGLTIVDALAKDWGFEVASSGTGKVVWWTQTISHP
ncbi:anti-sigma regulatory factor (Ser/Thr protein kinase) [Nonomuraea polychroma]|uniref:Anti-sigma regulatory factor (Ser/Thr protein kinase) n=1 Tax=Nonomuraea polychroma TaxID=46176 RepID=A0A438MK23_9ACTN|nr:ATP-binding protein [Nonomuraea polychroma]RVX45848.1 anti-sigma regulatory factor (Ser/Thr protein kinase) [Nonomuraea polychroma]